MKKRVLALPIILAIIAACNRNDEVYQPPLITATSSASPAPTLVVPTPTLDEPQAVITPSSLSLDSYVSNIFASSDSNILYNELTNDQISAYNHLGRLQLTAQTNILSKRVNDEVMILNPSSAVALRAYLNRFTPEEQELILTTPISPADFSNASVNIHSTRDMPPVYTSLITELFIRSGHRPYVNDMSSEGAGRHSVYQAAEQDYFDDLGNIDPRTLAIVVEAILNDLDELYDGYYPGIVIEHEDYILSREFDIDRVVQTYLERAQENTGPVVHYYLTHSDIDLGMLIGNRFILDQYSAQELFPDEYLSALGERPLVVFIDSCPSSFLDKLERRFDNYNDGRNDETPELTYLIRTLDDGGDEDRRTPAGGLINVWMLANLLHEKSSLYFDHPITSVDDLRAIISGDNLLANAMDGEFDRVYNVTPIFREGDNKYPTDNIVWVTLRVFPEDRDRSYDNQAISGFTYRTNIDLPDYLLDRIPLAGMNLIYE